MRIYTRTGDRGQTSVPGGQRVDKDDAKVVAFGELDELGAALGLARSGGLEASTLARVARVQEELFALGSQLASSKASGAVADWVRALEREIDAADSELEPLRGFVLAGGCESGARLHLARAVCRRAERALVALSHREKMDPGPLAYLNRLSDWLFTMARLANHRAGSPEPLWLQPL